MFIHPLESYFYSHQCKQV